MAQQQSEAALVSALVDKLEQLQAGKGESSLSNELREQLLLLQRRQQQPARHRSSSLDVPQSPSTSSSSSTGPSFPSSPTLHSTNHSAAASFSDASFTALRSENDLLRAQLEASEQQREWASREVAELKRRLGMISLDELEELDLAGGGGANEARLGAGNGSASRERSNSRGNGSNGWSSNGSHGGAIRIPGAGNSSFSPPSSFAAARNFGAPASGQRTSSSFSSRGHPYPNSRGSSLNTAMTTPSSSYPATLPPPTSPASFSSSASGFQSFLHRNPGARAPPPSSVNGSARSNGSTTSNGSSFDDLTPSRGSYREDLREGDEGDAEDEGQQTPLSVSPGSRSGSLSRRASFSVGVAGCSAPKA